MDRDLVRRDQDQVSDEQAQDTFALAHIDAGVTLDPRELLGEIEDPLAHLGVERGGFPKIYRVTADGEIVVKSASKLPLARRYSLFWDLSSCQPLVTYQRLSLVAAAPSD